VNAIIETLIGLVLLYFLLSLLCSALVEYWATWAKSRATVLKAALIKTLGNTTATHLLAHSLIANLNAKTDRLQYIPPDLFAVALLDLRGFNLNSKLDIDPDFLKPEAGDHSHCDHDHGHCEHDHDHGHEHQGHDHHDHGHEGACNHPSHKHGHHHHHDDDVKSFVYRAARPFDPAKLEDFLGAIVQVYGPKLLRYKGVLNMAGTDRKVIFQGVHQLMGSDLGPLWGDDEQRQSKMVFIGIDLPRDILVQGLEQCLT